MGYSKVTGGRGKEEGRVMMEVVVCYDAVVSVDCRRVD